ncbi:UNVERIFIED_CONTAM: hypothetical protein HDU68_005294 [Siphonaria sp. JEL0065]|nr:hypothetical protein HDU68_005294 [Siphonaria sp. JEL0065]
MKFSILSILALTAVASAAPLFGAISYQVKNTIAFAKHTPLAKTAFATFETSTVTGWVEIDNEKEVYYLFNGFEPNSRISVAITNTTDSSKIFDVDEDGIADGTHLIAYDGSNIVSKFKGLGVVILHDRKACAGGVIIAGAPIEIIYASSTSGKATTSEDISLQQFLDSKAGIQAGSAVAMNKPPTIIAESRFSSKITGSVKVDVDRNVIASLEGLPPNQLVIVAITHDEHKEFKTSVVTKPLSYELVHFVADKNGHVYGVTSYKTNGVTDVHDVEPVGHDIVLYHDLQFCPDSIPMAAAVAAKA